MTEVEQQVSLLADSIDITESDEIDQGCDNAEWYDATDPVTGRTRLFIEHAPVDGDCCGVEAESWKGKPKYFWADEHFVWEEVEDFHKAAEIFARHLIKEAIQEGRADLYEECEGAEDYEAYLEFEKRAVEVDGLDKFIIEKGDDGFAMYLRVEWITKGGCDYSAEEDGSIEFQGNPTGYSLTKEQMANA